MFFDDRHRKDTFIRPEIQRINYAYKERRQKQYRKEVAWFFVVCAAWVLFAIIAFITRHI